MAYGPGESRFVEEKRHLPKPIPISETVDLDRERCILCDRCTRFADEVAGDPLIHFMGRGAGTEVNTFPDEPFSSYFSGNTVQICPVGALTATPYRFKARPWDLDIVRVDVHRLQRRVSHHGPDLAQRGPALPGRRLRSGELVLAVRQGSIRFRGDRLERPPDRAAGPRRRRSRRARSWTDAMARAAELIAGRPRSFGPGGVGVHRRSPAHQRERLRLGQARQGRRSAPTTSTPSSATASTPPSVSGAAPRPPSTTPADRAARSSTSGPIPRRSSASSSSDFDTPSSTTGCRSSTLTPGATVAGLDAAPTVTYRPAGPPRPWRRVRGRPRSSRGHRRRRAPARRADRSPRPGRCRRRARPPVAGREWIDRRRRGRPSLSRRRPDVTFLPALAPRRT